MYISSITKVWESLLCILKVSLPGYYLLRLLSNIWISLIYIFWHEKNQIVSVALFWDPKKWGHCLTTCQTAVVEVILAKAYWWRNALDRTHDTSLEREVRNGSPFLNWMYLTKQAVPMMPGHWAESPGAAGCSCSFHQNSSLFHKSTHKTSSRVPSTHPGHLADVTNLWENPLPS